MNEHYSKNKNKKATAFTFAILALLPIVPFFLITGVSILFVYSFEFDERRNCTYETDATIVDYFTKTDYDNNSVSYQHYPVYSYGYGENEYRAKGKHSLPEKKYEIGERTTILINLDNSEEFFDKNYSLLRVENNLFVLLFYIFSVLLLVDIVVIIWLKKVLKQESSSYDDYY
ncbi:MAG: hypothetical protein IKL31_05170 [Ruminococcus sp.]|nr:hypothetical protein [Ruminococcus sp.]